MRRLMKTAAKAARVVFPPRVETTGIPNIPIFSLEEIAEMSLDKMYRRFPAKNLAAVE